MITLEDQLREVARRLDDAATTATIASDAHATAYRSNHRWRLVGVVAAAAIATSSIAIAVGSSRHDNRRVAPSSSVDTTAVDSSSAATSVVTPAFAPVTTDPAVRAPLQPGAASDDVVELQTRLAALGLAVDATGLYDRQTEQAVWAFKTLFAGVSHTDLALDDAPSVVTSELWQQIESAQPLRPRRPGAAGSTHVEIYLPEQALAVFTNDEVALIAHVSSGNGAAWCETVRPDVDATGRAIAEPIEIPVCGVSTTPGGVFTVEHVVQGDFTGPLGRMINPLYFNHGIAIHGSRVVPLSAASHGDVRVIPQVADRLLDLVSVGDEVDVWGTDGRDPEQYTTTEMLPTFTFPDPNASAVVTPLLSGLTEPKARDLLAVKGLGIDVSYRDVAVGDPQIGRVIEQSPQFNESVPPGTTIRVTVGRALESPETPTPTT